MAKHVWVPTFYDLGLGRNRRNLLLLLITILPYRLSLFPSLLLVVVFGQDDIDDVPLGITYDPSVPADQVLFGFFDGLFRGRVGALVQRDGG